MKLANVSSVFVLLGIMTGCSDPAPDDSCGGADGAVEGDAETGDDADTKPGEDGGAADAEPSGDGETPSGDGGTAGGGDGGTPGGDGGAPDASIPSFPWVNVTNNLATIAAGGGDVIVAAQPGSPRVVAGVGRGKGLFATDDGGKNWFALGQGAGSDAITNGPTTVVFDPAHLSTWWEVGIYGDGVFKTTDNGMTFKHLGDSNSNDLVSVDFSDPDRKTLLAGPHETVRKLWLSRDGGGTWMDIGNNLPANSNYSTLPLVIDSQTFLVGSCGNNGGACGVFRSVDGGQNWTRATTDGPVAAPLWASNGTIYWSLYSGGGMMTSTDKGATWKKTAPGPVPLFYSASPVELPDGRVVTLGGERLQATSDGGKTWKPIGDKLPFPGGNCGIYGLTYSAQLKSFFLNHNDCSGNIVDDSVFSGTFDHTTN